MALVGHISGSIQSNSVIGVSGSVIVANRPESLFPTMPGNNVTFYVSGSTDGNDHSVFGGNLTSSGSLTLAGNILAHANTARTIFADVVDITIGGAASTVNVAGDLKISGNDIIASDGNTNITLTSNTLTEVKGDLQVSGNDVKMSGGTTALTFSGTGDVTVAGNLQITGNNIKSSTGATALQMTGSSVVIPGDLTVNGTTVTINTTNLEVKDAVIGLGFNSGTIGQSGNDRGWIGSLGNGPHAAFLWKHTDNEFASGFTNSSATGSLPIAFTSYANFHAANIQATIVTASLGFSGSLTKLIDGTSYIIAGTNITVTTGSNGSITIDGSASGAPDNANYLLVGGGSGTGILTSERTFVAGTGLTATDGGANGNYTLSINNGVVATISGSTFTGAVKFNAGLSGSLTNLVDGSSYLVAGTGIAITTGSNGAVTIATSGVGNVTGPGSSTQYAVALFDDTTGKVLRNSQLTTNGTDSLWIASNLNISGSTVFGDSPSSDTVSFTARVASNVEPSQDMLYNLGSPSRRWNNIFTGDLHLRNERGDYTLIEEEDMLTIRFNKTGKRYKFVLEAVPELDEK